MEHWSHSSIAMLSKCPRQFWYRYILGWKIPPNAARNFGLSYHHTLETNFRYKKDNGQDLSIEAVKDIFSDQWERDAIEIDWNCELDNDKDSLKDIGVGLVGNYIKYIASDRIPKEVEYEFEVTLPEIDRPFVGVIDLITTEEFLIDHKTASRKWSAGREDNELQVTAYYMSFDRLFGHKPNNFIYDVGVKTRKAEIQVLPTQRNDGDIQEYLERIRVGETLVEKELYPKTDPSNWYCSERWCGYYNHCMRGVPLHRLRLTQTESISDAF